MTGETGFVLIVEDSEECAATIEIALATTPGLTISVANTAEQAIQILETESPAAIITDLHLPGMSGLDLLTYIRRQGRWDGIPVLVISGDADPRTPERARIAGANAFFSKPYSPVAVRHKLEELIHAR